MFGRKPKEVDVKLDEVVNRIIEEMHSVGPYSPEYPKLIGHLQKMLALRRSEDVRRVSRDTLATVIGGLLQVGIIVAYERMHVVTSKGFNLLLKSK